MHAVRKINADIHLGLVLRSVPITDHSLQLESSWRIRPSVSVETVFSECFSVLQIKLRRERRKPEFAYLGNSGSFRGSSEIIHNSLQLSNRFYFRQMFSHLCRIGDDQRSSNPATVHFFDRLTDRDKVIDPHAGGLASLKLRILSLDLLIKQIGKFGAGEETESPCGNVLTQFISGFFKNTDKIADPLLLPLLFQSDSCDIAYKIDLSGARKDLGNQEIPSAEFFVIRST